MAIGREGVALGAKNSADYISSTHRKGREGEEREGVREGGREERREREKEREGEGVG